MHVCCVVSVCFVNCLSVVCGCACDVYYCLQVCACVWVCVPVYTCVCILSDETLSALYTAYVVKRTEARLAQKHTHRAPVVQA